MNQVPMFQTDFVNTEWKDEWGVWVPGMEGKLRYKDASYAMDADGTRHVFDGAGNFRGDVLADGTMKPNDPGTDALVREMNMTFLTVAKKTNPNASNTVFEAKEANTISAEEAAKLQ